MERPKIKDKAANAYIDYVEAKLKKFTENPNCDSYMTLKMIVDASNRKIRELNLDFMADDSDKVMAAIEKFASKQKMYVEQLEYFRNKMTPPERKDVEAMMEEQAGIAERIALSEKK